MCLDRETTKFDNLIDMQQAILDMRQLELEAELFDNTIEIKLGSKYKEFLEEIQ
jgi:hypothetical protein